MKIPEIYFRKKGDIKEKLLEHYSPYLAGLFDGEGSFVLVETGKNGINFSPIIEISMTHKKTINFVANIFNVTIGKPQKKGINKTTFPVKVTAEKEIIQICKSLFHHSITKKKQIELMLQLISLKFDRKKMTPQIAEYKKISEKMIEIFIQLRKENERSSKNPPDYESLKEKLENKLNHFLKS